MLARGAPSALRRLSTLPAVPRALSKAADVRRRIGEHEAAALLGGGAKRIEAQHGKGKLTARERTSAGR
jgi:propionyl-CoA carboxylase beta chain